MSDAGALNNPQSVTCPPLCTEQGLRQLFALLEENMCKLGQPLLIIDDLSILEWFGFTAKDVHRFLRAILTLIRAVCYVSSLWRWY
jgi:hypothetical protein